MSHVFKFLSCVFAIRQLGTVALTYFLVLMLHSNSHIKVSLTCCWHQDLKFLSTAFSWCQFLQRADKAHWLWLYFVAYRLYFHSCLLLGHPFLQLPTCLFSISEPVRLWVLVNSILGHPLMKWIPHKLSSSRNWAIMQVSGSDKLNNLFVHS